ncbi:PIH1 domain-containing protein 2 isoform X1 [Arvicanthis niloticus]|uniref:PIH1 domain-containing protein 2 isoform X1 n=1 Tax=Arvicanthis niloticus TaxID=61156 RepID=UPI001486F698|nr:PIH1 domain-containing protein 2 [Arvicanthis niloticus]XP_034347121.1 PIH1 domain-containing protein 2 [Arvicanthis niloticus]
MKASSKGLLTHISQFWSMLDDLAENDPKRYQNFIQQELKDGKQFCVDPEPQLCLQTKILKPKEKVLFINLCEWERIPAPQSATHPVPVSVGRPEDSAEASDTHTIIDVAYNPRVLQAAEKDQGIRDQLIRMAMLCIEERLRLTLAHSYCVTSFRLKGSIQRMKARLMGTGNDFPDFKAMMRTENTLERIRSSAMSEPNLLPEVLLTKTQASAKGRCLIEEISSSQVQVEVKKPAYELKVVKDQNKKPLKIELKVELPGIKSVSLCELSVSEVDLLIEVSEMYRLYLNLPESINTETTTAKFVKNKSVLIITMPLA